MILILIGIGIHKFYEALALANLIKNNNTNKHRFISFFLYAITTPTGIILGMFLQYYLPKLVFMCVIAISSAFTAGFFLYVALIEIIAEEFHDDQHKWLKLGSLTLGSLSITILRLFFYH